MFLGHFGVALAAKRAAPNTSVGWLVFAAQWADELWPLLLIAGVEQVRIQPGYMKAQAMVFEHYPWSHSLLMLIVWGVLMAVVYRTLRANSQQPRASLIIGLLVVSHWFLDLPMHAPDLPLWPGNSPKFGWGLWNSVAGSYALEALFFGTGLVMYLRQTRARDRVGSWGLYVLLALLVFLQVGSSLGAPPSDQRLLGVSSLPMFLFPLWFAWADRHRAPNDSTPNAVH